MSDKIPKSIEGIIHKINKAGFEAFAVGGCVRDWLLKKEPEDWDITTSARPEEIVKIFPDSFYENRFGTVGVKISKNKRGEKAEPEKKIVEITTYRQESKYSDKRHPDEIHFAKKLTDDLKRRDFTINAMALALTKNTPELIDLFFGKKDLQEKIIRAVGIPEARFSEDALRMLRAIRFSCQLDFSIEEKTFFAIRQNSPFLKHISQERIQVEFVKIILSPDPAGGVEMLRKTGLLKFILPELEEGVGVKQNRHHIYTIYKHSLLSLKFCPSQKLEVRLAALLHDIAKPQTKRGEGLYATFYNHDHAGARLAEKILKRLRFSEEIVAKVRLLISNHMFYYTPEEVTESSVRKLIQRVGLENMKDLIDLRIADRLGSGTPKAKPYKLRHLEYVVEKVSTDPLSVKMLKINGNDLIKELEIKPGPKIGAILDVLLSEVIEDPKKNEKNFLLKRSQILKKENLENLRKAAKIKIEEKKEEEDQEIKSKHWVK